MATQPNNLPAPVTSFIGRTQELSALVDDLNGRARLVTLTGTGGVGKTRLAQETAWHLLETPAFPDGLWWVELASVSDARHVDQAVASVLGLVEEPERPFAEVLRGALRARRLLVVLDNCEHLVDACAVFAHALLRACPRISILATSREPLKAHGEVARHLPPLARPDPRRMPPHERLREFEAVRLFVDRAAAANDAFRLTDANAQAVVRVCEQLDGIPLALELAAARVRVLSPEQIAARLEDRFRLLAEGSRTAPPRQQTLEAAVAWSYDLLAEPEQRLFTRLAVFRGGWTLEAAEAICGDPCIGMVLDVLGRLVEKSLVVADDGPAGARWFRMPETIRHFAAERLRSSGEEREIRERHFRWYVQLALDGEYNLRFAPIPWIARVPWLERLRWEIANLRYAWQWPLEGDGDPGEGLRLVAGLFPYFWSGFLNEGTDCHRRMLERHRQQSGEPSPARAWALATASKLASHYGDDDLAAVFADEYFALPPDLQTPLAASFVLNTLGFVYMHRGDFARARDFGQRGIAAGRTAGDMQAVALYLGYLAAIAQAEGHLDEAQDFYQQSVAMGREVDFPPAAGLALARLAELTHARGQRTEARELYRQAQIALRDMGAMPQIALLLSGLGDLELEVGNWRAAALRFGESLGLALEVGYSDTITRALRGVGTALASAEPPMTDLMRAGLQVLGACRVAADDASLARARVALGDATVVRCLEHGARLSLEDACALARRALDGLAEHSADEPTRSAAAVLSRRELEVVPLLARGATNRQIAESLVIAERTAEMHVSNILTKLGLSSRAQVAAWAADQRNTVAAPAGSPVSRA